MSSEATTSVHVTKKFSAGRDKLYAAWTEEEQLKKWWKPMKRELQSVENDIREGGTVAYTFNDDLSIDGIYKEVEKGKTLVYTWNWEMPEETMHKGEYLLTVIFGEDGNGSTLDVTQSEFKDEQSITPHREGWEEALQQLQQYLDGSGS